METREEKKKKKRTREKPDIEQNRNFSKWDFHELNKC